ncbi:MAG: NTP transferase domain-containing protein [Alphaproteobacteria bacterium]|nr:NTP transferase domain-containing protein [Alphaproteobacteria bacterium]
MIGYIPARGGSKRIPGKNIRELGGKPILAYAIAALAVTDGVREVFVSSDDAEIGSIAERYGAKWLGPRPAELSDDKSGFIDLMHHDVPRHCDAADGAETVIFALATAALLTPELLNRAVDTWRRSQVDILMSVLEIGKSCYWALLPRGDGMLEPMFPEMVRVNSQDLPKAYTDAGQFYIFKPDVMQRFSSHKDVDRLLPFEIPAESAVDIDTDRDWDLLEFQFARNAAKR